MMTLARRSVTSASEEDAETHLESLEGNPRTANTIDSIDPSDYGYVRLDLDLEHGFHEGQDSDPKVVAKSLEGMGISRYLFNIDDQGQFDTRFSCYVHESEADLYKPSDVETEGPSVSGAMKRGLQEASRLMAELPEGGIKIAKINPDGTASAKVVSHEDFVEGKALK